jgi:hypothetical protein
MGVLGQLVLVRRELVSRVAVVAAVAVAAQPVLAVAVAVLEFLERGLTALEEPIQRGVVEVVAALMEHLEVPVVLVVLTVEVVQV